MNASQILTTLRDSLPPSARMPVVFLGHGSPMNAIEDTPFSRAWSELGRVLPKPQTILVVSAHWTTRGKTLVDVSKDPLTIHDFYGFPKPLYDIQYPAPGHPEIAREVVSLLKSHQAEEEEFWGLDHGAWTVLRAMYPDAKVPVFQVSLDMSKDLAWHLETGKILAELRDRGVLILGSGNVVHNLRALRNSKRPHDFAQEFDAYFADHLSLRDHWALTDRSQMGSLLTQAHPTLDHYLPALTIAGAAQKTDELTFFSDDIDLGSISMRSFVFHGA